MKCNLFRRISFFLDSYLFGICLLQIYPLTIKILQISQTQNHILEIVDSVTANDIELLTRRDMRYTEEVLDMEDNKMYILFDIGLKNIREAEILVPRLIINRVTEKFFELADKEGDILKLKQGIFILFHDFAMEAIRLQKENILILIIEKIKLIELKTIKLTFTTNLVWDDTNEIIEEILVKSLKEKLNQVTKRIIWAKFEIIEEAISYLPEENQLSLFMKTNSDFKMNFEKESIWRKFLDRLSWYQILEKIHFINADLINTLKYCSNNLITKIMATENIGIGQKIIIVDHVYFEIYRFVDKSFDEKNFETPKDFTFLFDDIGIFSDLMIANHSIAYIYFKYTIKFIHLTTRREKLNHQLINNLFMLIDIIITEIPDVRAKKNFIFALNAIKYIKNMNQSISNDTGIFIYKQLYNNLLEMMTKYKNDKTNRYVFNQLKKLIKSFTKIKSVNRKIQQETIVFPNKLKN